MSNLSNTEKFQALKKLNELKMQYHKEGITDFFSFPSMKNNGESFAAKIFNKADQVFSLYKLFKFKSK